MAALPLNGNTLHKTEIDYCGKFGHTIGRIQHIILIRRIEIFYTAFHLATQNVAHTLTGYQGLKLFIQNMDSHPRKPIFYPYNYYDG